MRGQKLLKQSFFIRARALVVGALAFFAYHSATALAEPSEPAALAATQAFLADPKAEFKLEKGMFRQRMDLTKIASAAQVKAFGEAKIVFSNGAVAIAATEFSAPNLTQTFYVRLRLTEGRWAVADWLPFRDLASHVMAMDAFEKLTQAEWDKRRVEMGIAALNMDLETMKENLRLAYGSDEVIMAALMPVLADLAALCRKIADTEAVGPLVTSVANADVSSMAPDVAALVEEARGHGIVIFGREGDSGLLGLTGMSADGRSEPSLARYLLCTPDEKSLSLQRRLTENGVGAIRDLGDGVYFMRH